VRLAARLAFWQIWRVTAPTYDREFSTAPQHANQRRYEALRAYFVDQVSVAQAGERAGYTRSTMATLLRDFRAGRVELFAPSGRPGPKSAPAKVRARARVIELRRQGLSTYEISARLRAEGTPLNRTGVGQILTGEGFGRLLRGPGPVISASPATAGRDTGAQSINQSVGKIADQVERRKRACEHLTDGDNHT
jgi:transposase